MEDRAPAERVDEQARWQRAQREAEPDRGAEKPESPPALGRWGAQGRQGRRRPVDEPAADALHGAPGQRPAEGRRDADEEEADDAHRHAGPEDRGVTEPVGRGATDEGHDGVRQDVADDDPAHPLGRRLEGRGDRGEGDVDHRVERHDERAGRRD